MKSKIIVTFDVEGLHNWPLAFAHSSEFYLMHEHRHVFKVRVEKVVNHDDRDVEFISAKRAFTELFRSLGEKDSRNGLINFGAKSCEIMAKTLLGMTEAEAVEVHEDGENGARVEA